jgi:hypothetical protein
VDDPRQPIKTGDGQPTVLYIRMFASHLSGYLFAMWRVMRVISIIGNLPYRPSYEHQVNFKRGLHPVHGLRMRLHVIERNPVREFVCASTSLGDHGT